MFRVQGSGHRVCCSYRDVSCSRSGIFVKASFASVRCTV